MPFSPVSWLPLLFRSLNTPLPTLNLRKTPRSSELLVFGSVSPSVIGSEFCRQGDRGGLNEPAGLTQCAGHLAVVVVVGVVVRVRGAGSFEGPVSAPFVPVLLVNPTSGPVPVKLVAASRTR